MSAKKKITRKQLLKQPDEFITLSTKIGDFIREQGRLVALGLGGVVGVLLLGGLFYFYQGHNREQANLLEAAAYNAYHGQVIGAAEAPLSSARASVFTSNEERYRTAQAKYQELLSQYPDTPNARRAQLYLGNCAYYLGEYQQAQRAYQEFLQETPQDNIWYQQVLHSLAYAQEEAGEYLKAAQTYRRVIDLAPGQSKPIIYLDLARTYEQAKSWQQAEQAYESMLNFASTPGQKKMLEDRLRQLRVRVKGTRFQE